MPSAGKPLICLGDMNFIRKSSYHQLSDCAHFSVAAYREGEAFVFAAWRLNPRLLLGIFDTAGDARARCELESDALAKQAA